MKKNISILLIVLCILVISTLILFAEDIKYGFQNEPDGFRGLKWGDPPTEDMLFTYQVVAEYNIYRGNYYYRRNDELNIGSAKLYSILYIFNLYGNQFYKMQALFIGETNYNILKIIFEGRFGKPTRKDKNWFWWWGDKAIIILGFNPKEQGGIFHIKSTEIHSESLKDNKQKELEKAKEDF